MRISHEQYQKYQGRSVPFITEKPQEKRAWMRSARSSLLSSFKFRSTRLGRSTPVTTHSDKLRAWTLKTDHSKNSIVLQEVSNSKLTLNPFSFEDIPSDGNDWQRYGQTKNSMEDRQHTLWPKDRKSYSKKDWDYQKNNQEQAAQEQTFQEQAWNTGNDPNYYQEASEDFWDILAGFSQFLFQSLRLEGLLFCVQMAVFSLLLQHYLPPWGRYYLQQVATIALLPSEKGLEQLLNEDILLTDLPEDAGFSALSINPPANSSDMRGAGGGDIQFAAIQPVSLSSTRKKEPLESVLNPVVYQTREYTVNRGEHISLLASRYHLRMSTLISVNRIKRAKNLKAGQTIHIPNIDGLLYDIQPGDNLERIAKKFDLNMGALIDINQLQSEVLQIGHSLFIPGATLSSYELRKVFGNLYIYPHAGRISSYFGYRNDPFRPIAREFHNGIDIAGSHGSPVKASSDGKVVSAGYHGVYGNYVIVQHAKGIKTLYGHLSQRLVVQGQSIIQGQKIGLIGSSGRSTGPHVHFTIFVGGKAVNPQDYLSGSALQEE